MPSFVITGVSRGIGWAFLSKLSDDPNNIVFGLVRNHSMTIKRVEEELSKRPIIVILQADLTDYCTLEKAANTVSKRIESLDYLIANAGIVSQFDAYDGLGVLGVESETLTKQFHTVMDTNVLGNIHLINLFMPLLLKSQIKKVAIISSAMADMDLVNTYELKIAPIYATSKAAVNMIAAKFNAEYKKYGVLVLSICPGMVDVGHHPLQHLPPAKVRAVEDMLAKAKLYEPSFAGPNSPECAVESVMSVIENSDISKGHGGACLSHRGTNRWI